MAPIKPRQCNSLHGVQGIANLARVPLAQQGPVRRNRDRRVTRRLHVDARRVAEKRDNAGNDLRPLREGKRWIEKQQIEAPSVATTRQPCERIGFEYHGPLAAIEAEQKFAQARDLRAIALDQ